MPDPQAVPAEPFRLDYRPSLDGLRGVAILFVLLYHFHAPVGRGGFVGVDLFFVLSGFLITALLCQEWAKTGRIDFLGFYRRRALRLLPALIAAIVLLLGLALLFQSRYLKQAIEESLMALFYVMNWFRAYRIRPDSGLLGHTWSLSIEEQFYLVWPGLFALLMRSRLGKGGILACVLAGLAASAGMRAVHWLRYHDWFRVYYGLDSRADSLLAGCLLGFLAGWNLLPRSPVWRIGGGLGAAYVLWIAILPLEEGLQLTLGQPILNLAACLIVVSLLLPGPSALRRILEFPALVWVGKISYGLYLWHLLVYQALLKLRWVDVAWSYGLACVLSIAAAAVSYYGLEIHFLKRKRRPAAPTPDPGT